MPKRRDENAYYWKRLRYAEKTLLEDALRAHGSLRSAAKVLGVSPNYVSDRIAQLGIAAPKTRPGPKPATPPTPGNDVPGNNLAADFFTLVAENLFDVIADIAVNPKTSINADCRFVADLVRRGIYTRRDAAVLLHRIKLQQALRTTKHKETAVK